MPQRDAARASSAPTGRSTVPAAGPTLGAARPAVADTVGPHPVGTSDTVATHPAAADTVAPDPVAPHPVAPHPVPSGADVRPHGAHPADPRAAARASLAAGRSPSLWWVCTGIVAVLVVSFTVAVTQGVLVLAGLLAVSAVVRAIARPGPVALSVRSRATDCTVLTVLAVGVGLLAHLAPTG